VFREVARKKQELPREECLEILQNEKRGTLALLGDDGYPYAVPLNHWYCPEDGHLYFHSGNTGHKIDAIQRYDKACFCVYDMGEKIEGHWALRVRSVIAFGRIRIVEDHERALEICRRLSYKFTDDEAYIQGEVERSGHRVLVFELVPEHITGKRVTES